MHSRWCFLKCPESLTDKQELRLRELPDHESAVGEGVPDEGGVPAILGVHLRGQCREIPDVVVPDGDEESYRTDEEEGANASVAL